jgi:hypothetical protein
MLALTAGTHAVAVSTMARVKHNKHGEHEYSNDKRAHGDDEVHTVATSTLTATTSTGTGAMTICACGGMAGR